MSEAECDSSEDEEEILVYVEFEGFVDNSTFSNEKLQLDMTGLDTDFPIMQVNGKFYEGTYEDAVGTYMFFEKDDNPTVDDSVFDTIPTLKYFAKTRKLLKMQRVFTMPRPEVLGDSDHTYCVPNMDTIKDIGVPPKYQEDALRLWTKMRDDRMEALSEYLKKQKIRDEKRSRGIEPESESDEDSPFAMYKPKKNTEAVSVNKNSDGDNAELEKVISSLESERISGSSVASKKTTEFKESHTSTALKFKKTRRKLTVIDPGPSTSRDSLPYIAPPAIKRKHKATVKIVKRSKVKDVFKKPFKRAPRRKHIHYPENEASENAFQNIEFQTSDAENEDIADSIETEDRLEPLKDTAEEVIIENEKIPPEQNDERKIVSCLKNKRLEKQARREAKMQEITERLRKQRDDTLNVKISKSGNLETINK